jgi:hypothetical protein
MALGSTWPLADNPGRHCDLFDIPSTTALHGPFSLTCPSSVERRQHYTCFPTQSQSNAVEIHIVSAHDIARFRHCFWSFTESRNPASSKPPTAPVDAVSLQIHHGSQGKVLLSYSWTQVSEEGGDRRLRQLDTLRPLCARMAFTPRRIVE